MPTTGRKSGTRSEASGRLGEKLFGLAAIVVGVAIVVATLVGVGPGSVVLILASAAVVGWFVYYLGFRRQQTIRSNR
jgi:Flp pilus assembly protein TadB